MNGINLSLCIAAAAATLMAATGASACVTKTGKDCASSVAHKTVYNKKLIKRAPAGGVGLDAHSLGFDALGVTTFTAAPTAPPDPQQNFGTNPDGWFYLMPSSTGSGGFAPRPMPHRVMAIVSANSQTSGPGALINPDGSLTRYAINIGWARTGAPVPVAVTPSTPTVTQAQPSLPQYRPPVPQQTGAPSQPVAVPVPVPNAIAAPALLPGHAADGPARAHPEKFVDVYHPTKAGVYRYADAHKIGDPAFHFVVIGFREPE